MKMDKSQTSEAKKVRTAFLLALAIVLLVCTGVLAWMSGIVGNGNQPNQPAAGGGIEKQSDYSNAFGQMKVDALAQLPELL